MAIKQTVALSSRPRAVVGCGQNFCAGCLAKVLRKLPVSGERKKLSCPTCRQESSVPCGRAAELPIIFDLMDWNSVPNRDDKEVSLVLLID